MNLIEAVEEVLDEDARTRKKEYNWLLLAKVLRLLEFKIYIEFSRQMPEPETIFRARRELINKRNKYPDEFVPEEGVTYGKKKGKK